MEEHPDNSAAVVTRYLLGELAEQEQRRYEEELMTGARSFEELLAAEDELIDRYVAGALAAPDRERFEQYFLAAPERRRKLSFARTLHSYISDADLEETALADTTEVASEVAADDLPPAAPSSTTTATDRASTDDAQTVEPSTDGDPSRHPARGRFLPPFLQTSSPLARYAVAALLLLVVSASAFVIFNRARGPRTDGPVLAFTLTPGAVRGASDGGVKQINIAPGTGLVELRLSLAAPDAARQRYRADIAAIDEDRPVFSTPEDTKPVADAAGTHVPVRVPADLLTPGNYKLRLTAAPATGDFEDVATYYFTVIPQ